MSSILAAETQELYARLRVAILENEQLKRESQLIIAIVVHACPGHEITISEDDMLQNYELKQEQFAHNKTVTFKARKV